jgi:hypothetical protein
MAEMGLGYGSECHLLRYLGRHRKRLDQIVKASVGAEEIDWLDWDFDASKTMLDRELKGVDFLETTNHAHKNWPSFWPQSGNQPNWDAVARIHVNGVSEWLLVEAKANIQELKSWCKADPTGGLPLITRSLTKVKSNLGVAEECDWLNGYYQYCNRIAVLEFLNRFGTPSRLLFVYFVGDKIRPGAMCPAKVADWQTALIKQKEHVGLDKPHGLSNRVHEIYLDVYVKPTAPKIETATAPPN